MKEQSNSTASLVERNKAVKSAYLQIYKSVRALLCTLEEEPLRQILLREEKSDDERGTKVHEFISPLVYFSLECDLIGDYAIHYGYEQTDQYTDYYPITSAFIRLVYKHTMKEATAVDIESSVTTDFVITNCAELFEYIGDRNKFHTIKQLPYKPLKRQGKQLSVA